MEKEKEDVEAEVVVVAGYEDIPYPRVEEEELAWGRGVKGSPRMVLNTHKALINPEDSSLYALVSKDYQLVRHEVLVGVVEEVLEHFLDYGERKRLISFSTGGKMRLEYRFPEVTGEVAVGDLIHPTLTFFNSYDESWALRGLFGAHRVVCENGATVGEAIAAYRREHHQIEEDMARLIEMVRRGMEKFDYLTRIFRDWSGQLLAAIDAEKLVKKIGWSEGQYNRLLAEPETTTEIKLEDLFGRPERRLGGVKIPPMLPSIFTISRWTLYNVITQFITHRLESPAKRKRLESMVAKAFMG